MTTLARSEAGGIVYPLAWFSPSDRRFDRWKRLSIQIALCYAQTALHSDKSQKIKECSGTLTFSLSGQGTLKLYSARFCRQRFCFVCAWRRRRIWINRLNNAFEHFIQHNEMGAFLLTLSQRNCRMDQLGIELRKISASWKALVKVSHSRYALDFPYSFLKSIEVTKNFNPYTSEVTFHPHIHALFFVPYSYFSSDSPLYIPQNSDRGRLGWLQRWQIALDIDYLPTAHVKAIPLDKMNRAIAQTCKYLLKPAQFLAPELEMVKPGINAEVLDWLTLGTKGVRSLSIGGDFRRYVKAAGDELGKDEADPLDDYIRVSGGDSASLREGDLLTFVWAESPYVKGSYQYFLAA